MAGVNGSRTHLAVLSHRRNGFEDRGAHQDSITPAYYLRLPNEAQPFLPALRQQSLPAQELPFGKDDLSAQGHGNHIYPYRLGNQHVG